VDVAQPPVPACPLPIASPTLSEANHPGTIDIDAVAEVLYLYPKLTRCYAVNDILALAWEGETIGRAEDTYPYTQVMADADAVLEEARDNLKESGQPIRATQTLMRSQGMTEGEIYATFLRASLRRSP
jgi:hypothetical protein